MKPGDHIAWRWLNGLAQGVVKSVHSESVTIESKGKLITRHGTKDNPAIIITHKSGNDVLKLSSEVQKTWIHTPTPHSRVFDTMDTNDQKQ